MSAQERALIAISTFLHDAAVPYMVIGGIANIVWGEPRATLDIDVTVWIANDKLSNFIRDVAAQYRVLVDAPEHFVRRTRVLPIEGPDGVRVDIIFGLLPMEEEAIRRARAVPIAGSLVMICAPEDLILLKIISDRPQDIADARAVALRRMRELDLTYLDTRIRALARELERDDILAVWSQWQREAGM